MKHRPTPGDMVAAGRMLEALAAPLEGSVYLRVRGPVGDQDVYLQPATAGLLRELFAYIACGESVSIMNWGPQQGSDGLVATKDDA